MTKSLLCIATVVLLAIPMTAGAGLLEDYFGVVLETGEVTLGETTFLDVFVHDWNPTLHIATTDMAMDDWYGKDVLSFDPWVTLFGSVPSGGEVFDVEAIYLDNNAAFLYLSIVTSFPPDGFTHPEIPDFHVVPGDIAIGLNGGTYDFGIDVDGGTGDLYATDVSDWFVYDESHSVAAQGELANFSGGTLVGSLDLTYQATGVIENEFDTHVIEVVIPMAYLGHPMCGSEIYVHWVCSCRNDATGSNPILKLFGELDGGPSSTEPSTWSSMKALFR
ncbi:MAG: hypothetical protein KAW17_12440 [Candidatus Eisenbacteria sp.]|nr:hypothetical protein [Candidatus Eisenbacteria bacterium]